MVGVVERHGGAAIRVVEGDRAPPIDVVERRSPVLLGARGPGEQGGEGDREKAARERHGEGLLTAVIPRERSDAARA
jgi:hypothetical protein